MFTYRMKTKYPFDINFLLKKTNGEKWAMNNYSKHKIYRIYYTRVGIYYTGVGIYYTGRNMLYSYWVGQ